MKTRAKNTICFLVTGIDFFISKGYPLFPYSKLTKLNDGLSVVFTIANIIYGVYTSVLHPFSERVVADTGKYLSYEFHETEATYVTGLP